MPKPFLNKLIVHGAIGFFCVLFGCIYGFITDDQIFLLMSLCIGVGTAIRIVSLLHTIKMHDYTELTGTCTKREVSPLTKKQKIIFRSTDQKEYHFTFDKNIRLLSGEYSCAVTPQVRQTGNRLSGLAGTAYASLLT